MRERLGLIEPDDSLRIQLIRALHQAGLEAEPFENLREFLLFRGTVNQAVIVADDRVDALTVHDALGREGEWLPVIAYSDAPALRRIVTVVRGGGYDYFSLPLDAQAVAETLGHLGGGTVAYALARRRAAAARAKLEWLSPREAEVLASMAGGRSNKAIGKELGISPRTVEIHRANMLSKLGANSSTEALRMFYEHDLLNGAAASPGA